jgi:hypothetical protein
MRLKVTLELSTSDSGRARVASQRGQCNGVMFQQSRRYTRVVCLDQHYSDISNAKLLHNHILTLSSESQSARAFQARRGFDVRIWCLMNSVMFTPGLKGRL